MAKRRFIAIYGGTQLTTPEQGLVAALSREVIENPDFVLVTGGFEVCENRPSSKSTDWGAAYAAQARLQEKGASIDARLETWLPDTTLDRHDEHVRRFGLGKVLRRQGSSDLG